MTFNPNYRLKIQIMLGLMDLERLIRMFERFSEQLLTAAKAGDRKAYDNSMYAVRRLWIELKKRDPLAYEAWLETPTGTSPRAYFLTPAGRA